MFNKQKLILWMNVDMIVVNTVFNPWGLNIKSY